MQHPLRLIVRLQLSRHLLRRQPASRQPCSALLAHRVTPLLSLQPVQHRPQRRRKLQCLAVLTSFLLQLLRQAAVLRLRLLSLVRDHGRPSTISSQAYTYSVQRTLHYTFLPAALGDLALPALLRVTVRVMVIIQSISLPNSSIIYRKPDRSSSLF